MGYLLYCIFSSLESRSPGALVGVDGQPVFLVSHGGLSAAMSRIGRSNMTPEISRILAYQRVVESFHCHPAVGGVIPVRYGSLFEEKPQIIRLLEERCEQYKALLKELDGCLEMGIRILTPKSLPREMRSVFDRGEIANPWPRPGHSRSSERKRSMHEQRKREHIRQSKSRQGGPKSQIPNPGHAYLAARKAHYAQQEKFDKQAKQVIERYRAAFDGLFVKCKTEFPSIDNPSPCGIPHRGSPTSRGIPQGRSTIGNRQSAIGNLFLSLYYLVPRSSVNRFRQVFRQVNVKESPKLLLSGPWPPYNFVQLDHMYSHELIFPSPCEQGGLCRFYEGIATKP